MLFSHGRFTVFSNITIENCEFVNNSFGGIIIKQYNNGYDQYHDCEGWAGRRAADNASAPDYYDKDWHPFQNIVIRGNYINQGASAYACNGMYLCGIQNSVVEKNVLEHIGTCGIELFYADNVAVQYNEISDVAIKCGGADNNAIDPDWRTTNILVQYNYVHDCGEGILLCGIKFSSGIVRYNLIQDVTKSYVHYSMGDKGYFQFYNNVFYRSAEGNGVNIFDSYGDGKNCTYVNNVFYDAKNEGFNFERDNNSGGRPKMKNNAYYGGAANPRDESPILLTTSPFEGSAPAITRKGNSTSGAMLEANGLMPKLSSALFATGIATDSNGITIDEGLSNAGTKLDFSSLKAQYGMESGIAEKCVYITRNDYPLFSATDATLDTQPTQRPADATSPSIGIFERELTATDVILKGTVTDSVNVCPNAAITVTVGDKTVKTTSDANGNFRITDGLIPGGAYLFYHDRSGNVKSTNLTRKQTETAEQPAEKATSDHYPNYHPGGNHHSGNHCGGNRGGNIKLNHKEKLINTNPSISPAAELPESNGEIDENVLENIVLPTLAKHKCIPLAYMAKPALMQAAIHYLTGYNFRQQHPYQANGVTNDARQSAFALLNTCLAEMCYATGTQTYHGALVTADKVLAEISRTSNGCEEDGLEPYVEDVLDTFLQAISTRKVKNLPQYMKSLLWTSFATYKLNAISGIAAPYKEDNYANPLH